MSGPVSHKTQIPLDPPSQQGEVPLFRKEGSGEILTEIVIGTSNPGKINEVKRFLGDLAVSWLPTSEQALGITIDENAETFEGNAELKARAFAAATNRAVLAGDGGMEIPALNNWPGLKSRRLDADRYHTDEELIEIMQQKIASLPVEQRQFRFVTAWSLAVPGQPIVTARGELFGTLKGKPHPKLVPGFPYRRFWWIPKFEKYFLDLTPDEYNTIHHNRIAFDQLRPMIEAYIKRRSHFLGHLGGEAPACR